ncbi:alpha/beta fold hydrolase [Aquimarina algiphila]|uniref:alpha/beta fold hydrolase n=1 Tax=Aquimarina algiphila TaxID=2047982 RepID=UPI00232AA2CC|nr:alpha/beta hydrolase [Aquimarina algiphila]
MDLIIDNHRLRLSTTIDLIDKRKPTFIFLHDSLGCNELWRDFPQKLASETGYNAISYDRQGYGQSEPFTILERDHNYLKKEAQTLGKIIKHLSLKNVILFGHSDGGSIALLAAALFPESIIGIITEGAHVFVEQETINGIKAAIEAYKNTNLREKLIKYHGDKTDDVFRVWTKTWLSKSYQSWNIEEYLPHIICPSLIIQGKKDEYGTIDQVNAIVNTTKGNSTSLLIPEVGHTPHRENPEVVIGETIKFVRNL